MSACCNGYWIVASGVCAECCWGTGCIDRFADSLEVLRSWVGCHRVEARLSSLQDSHHPNLSSILNPLPLPTLLVTILKYHYQCPFLFLAYLCSAIFDEYVEQRHRSTRGSRWGNLLHLFKRSFNEWREKGQSFDEMFSSRVRRSLWTKHCSVTLAHGVFCFLAMFYVMFVSRVVIPHFRFLPWERWIPSMLWIV